MEEWRPAPGYEGRYEVSSLGRVRGIGTRSRGIRKPYLTKAGHHQYCLYSGDGKHKSVLVHVLVAGAFIGPCPPGLICCHDNGDGSQNHLGNIRYDTPKSNSEDMVRHGNSLPGERNHQAKLTDDQVRRILGMKGTASYRTIAIYFDVSFTTIQKIMSGEGWRHVNIPEGRAVAGDGPCVGSVERAMGLNMELVREHIASLCAGPAAVGAVSVRTEGVRFEISNNAVTTCAPDRQNPSNTTRERNQRIIERNTA